MFNTLEKILGDLNFKSEVEGVNHPETVLASLKNEEAENFNVIQNEVFSLVYSKTYKTLKFFFNDCSGIDIEPFIISNLAAVQDSLTELETALKQLH